MKEVIENNMCVKKFYAPLREVKNVIDGEHHNWLSTFFKRLGRDKKESVAYLEEIRNLKFHNAKLQTQLVFTASRSFSELKEAAKMVENNHQELKNTQQELKNTHQELEEVKAQLETANITSTNSSSQVQSLQQQLQEANQANQANQQLCSSKEYEVSELTSRLAEVENTKTALYESKAEIEKLRAELESVKNGKQQMESSKDSEIQYLQSQLQDQVAKAGDADQQSRSDVAELQRELHQVKGDNQRMYANGSSQLLALQEQLDSARSNAAQLDASLHQSTSKFKSLERQYNNDVEKMEHSDHELRIAKELLNTAQRALTTANEKVSFGLDKYYQNDLRNKDATIDRLQMELNEVERQRNDNMEDWENERAENQRLIDELKTLNQKLGEYVKKEDEELFADLVGNLSSIKVDTKPEPTRDEQIDALKTEVSDLKDDVRKLTAEKAKLDSDFHDEREEHSACFDELSKLRRYHHDVEYGFVPPPPVKVTFAERQVELDRQRAARLPSRSPVRHIANKHDQGGISKSSKSSKLSKGSRHSKGSGASNPTSTKALEKRQDACLRGLEQLGMGSLISPDGNIVLASVEADPDTASAEGMDTDAPPAGSHPVTSMEDVDSPRPRSSMALSPSPPPR